MFTILSKDRLAPSITRMRILAPHIAKKARAGQFIILRAAPDGERIPLTIADTDAAEGSVTIIFQEVGESTMALGEKSAGDALEDFVGPLGRPSSIEGVARACVIGGGLGTAIAYPTAKALHAQGSKVDVIAGFRNRDLIMLEDEMRAVSDDLTICTDDGSNGKKGLVTQFLKEKLDAGIRYDAVYAIGPVIMMKFVAQTTKPYGVRTIVSMNSTMIDGTGMCGGCRLTVGGETKFACVDGPEFDGHAVDFDEALRRGAMYKKQEQAARERHACRLTGEAR